jgi:hypothetical protein
LALQYQIGPLYLPRLMTIGEYEVGVMMRSKGNRSTQEEKDSGVL